MRIFLLTCFFFTVCAGVSFAQESALPGEESAQSVFSGASDDNIKEAQRFFKYCGENDTMNRQKDCRCAATKYLETRMSLGDDASPEQILAENVNTCLKDARYEIDPAERTNIEKYSQKDIAEAEAFFEDCSGDTGYRISFDCECLASRFLEERHKRGPLYPAESIKVLLQLECRNVVETTGYEYSSCMSSPAFRNTNGIERKTFCECYARQWAKMYESFRGVVDSKSTMNMQANARGICKKPASYK